MQPHEILNEGQALATRYVGGEMTAAVKIASKDTALAVATAVSLPRHLQGRFAEKLIERVRMQ